MKQNNEALNVLYGDKSESILAIHEKGAELAQSFISQFDAYYASPTASFHDNKIARKFYDQRLRHINFTPYPNDGLITFGASGTNKCDREIFFKNAKVKVEKTPDIPFRGRQRRVGSAVIEYLQLDIAHMEKRLGSDALFTFATTGNGEYAMEDAMQVRQVIEHNGIKFAITVKPDGILNYANEPDRRFIFEYKTKASGVVEMNGKLNNGGSQDDHLRQVTAEAIVYGINEGFIVYESMHKPSWFSDEERKSVPKTRKTWNNGKPLPDFRAMYFYITDEMKTALLDDLARQAELVYNGEIPTMDVEMTSKCGFCPFKSHCKRILNDVELTHLIEVEKTMSTSIMAGKQDHMNLRNYLAEGV